jgi:hypothetical protein
MSTDASFGLQHALFVKSLNLRLVEFLCLVTLDLHRVCQDTLCQEGLSLEVNVLGLFEALKTALLADLIQINDEICSDALGCA